MTKTLNITNGDCAVEVMQKAKISGDFLPWRDVLHEGPVPADLNLEALSTVRAKAISDMGWGDQQKVLDSFIERDKTLNSYADYQEVVLWFEHDLYDQLQLIQLLDWFADKDLSQTPLSIICTDQYLGLCSPEELSDLHCYQQTVSQDALQLAKKAWAAFRSDTPTACVDLLKDDTSALPFLHQAILRLLDEYPSCKNGLSLTANITLEIIQNNDPLKPWKLFEAYQEKEQARFLGDSSFWLMLNQLLNTSPPLISNATNEPYGSPANPKQIANITPTGKEVLAGELNALDLTTLDKHIGGVHLHKNNIWCWDQDDIHNFMT